MTPTAAIEDSHCMSSAEIEITTWLAEASLDEILGVAERRWGEDEAATSVVSFYRTDSRVRDVLDTIEACMGDRHVPRVCCVVDGEAALDWLDQHRPDVAAAVREVLSD